MQWNATINFSWVKSKSGKTCRKTLQTLNDGMEGLCIKTFMNLTGNVEEITAGRFNRKKWGNFRLESNKFHFISKFDAWIFQQLPMKNAFLDYIPHCYKLSGSLDASNTNIVAHATHQFHFCYPLKGWECFLIISYYLDFDKGALNEISLMQWVSLDGDVQIWDNEIAFSINFLSLSLLSSWTMQCAFAYTYIIIWQVTLVWWKAYAIFSTFLKDHSQLSTAAKQQQQTRNATVQCFSLENRFFLRFCFCFRFFLHLLSHSFVWNMKFIDIVWFFSIRKNVYWLFSQDESPDPRTDAGCPNIVSISLIAPALIHTLCDCTKRKVNRWKWIDENEKFRFLFIYSLLCKRNVMKMAMQNEKEEEQQ